MTLTYEEYIKKNKKQIEERNKREYEKNAVSVKKTTKEIAPFKTAVNDLLAPVRKIQETKEPIKTTTKKEDRSWFNTGLFKDGYDFGDVTKTLIGTKRDVSESVSKGILGIGEGLIDTVAYGVGGVSKLFGQDDFANKTQKFIQRDLIDEYKLDKSLASSLGPTAQLTKIANNILNKGQTQETSLFGDKSDSLIESGGQLLGTAGLQAVGVPWWLTTGVSSFGSETEQAFNSNATYGEAGFSGLVSAGAEILTEKISGGISFGGKTLDSTLTKAISEGISNKTVRTLTRLGVDMAGEGAEEVLSEVIQNIGKKLSYEDDKSWSEMLASEEAMNSYIESFIGGAVLGGAGSGVNIARDSQARKQIKTETENRIKELEQQGNKVTEAQKEQIAGEVVHEIVNNASNTQLQEEIAPIQETTQNTEVVKENALERLNQLEEIKQQATTEQQYNDIQSEINEVSKQVDQIQQQEQQVTEQKTKNISLEQQVENNLTKQVQDEIQNKKVAVDGFKNYILENKIDINDIKDTEINDYVQATYNDMDAPDSNITYLSEEQSNKIKEYINEYVKENQVPKGRRTTFKSVMSDNGKPTLKDVEGVKTTIQDVEVGIYRNKDTNDWHVIDLESGADLVAGKENRKTKKTAIENATKNIQENDLAPLRKKFSETTGFKNINKQETTTPTQKELDSIEDARVNKTGSEYAKEFGKLEKKYGLSEVYKSLNNYKETGKAIKEIAPVKELSESIQPIKAELNDLTNDLKMAIKDTKKELKSLTNDMNEVKTSIEEARALTEADIPMVEQQNNIDTLTDNDILPIQENTLPETETDLNTQSPLDDRDMSEVGNRKVKAYQFENPEVQPYFKAEAEAMLGELKDTVKGQKVWLEEMNPNTGLMETNLVTGTTRQTTDAIAYLKDNYNYTYAEIEKGLNDLIEDKGKENNAVAKRLELLIDERLKEGYTSIDGTPIPPNQEYLNFLDSQNTIEYNRATSEMLTDENAPIEDIAPVTENEIIARTKALQESSIENATENHPPLTDEFIEELTKQNIEMARESGKLKEVEYNASNTQQVEEIAPITEQPNLKEYMETEDPFLKSVQNQIKRHEPTKEVEIKLENDEYKANNNVNPKKKTLKESAKRTWDTFQSQFVNRNRQIDNLAKETGNNEIKFKGDRVNNISGEVGGDIYTAQTDNYGNVIGKPLDAPFQAARESGIDTYFDNYLKHQSNIERHERGKGSAAVDVKTSQSYVDAYESKYPQFKEWAKDVYTYNQNLLNNAVQNGLINDYFRDMLTSMYGKYVPFYGNVEAVDPSVYMSTDEIKTSKPIKRAKGGSDANLLGIERAMISQTYAYKNSIAKNDLYKEIGSSIGEAVDMGADVRNNPTDMESTLYSDENGKYLTYYEAGSQKTVPISDELYTELSRDLEKQLRNVEEKYSLISKPLQKISQIRGQILTTYNPGFVITNPFKDIQDALLNTKNFKGYLKNVINQSTVIDSEYGGQVNEFATEFKKLTGKDITSIKDSSTLKGKAKRIYNNYKAGSMWNRFISSYGTNATSMEYGDNGIEVKAKNKGFLNSIERANNYMEVMFRYPEFKATLEKGGSFTEALYNAREVTTNFGRGGTISKAINRNGATFFNTSIQGLDKFIRNFSGENGARGFVGAVSKAAAIGMIPAILNHLLFGDDDEYESIPDYVKDNYYLFKTGDGEFLRIPKGRMISVLGSAARRSLELAGGEEDAFKGYLKNATDQVGATNPLKENIFSPLIQAYGSEQGEAWYGGDLIPTRLQNKPAAEQFDEGTDEFSKWLGKQLNISPYKLNYVIDQYSGGFGDLILPTITEEAKSDGTLLAPLKDKFVVNSTDDNKYVGEIYDLGDEFTKKANSENATEEDKLKNKYLNSIKSEMSELYKLKREAQNSDMTKESKYSQVQVYQNMINALAKEGLDNNSVMEVSDNYASVGYKEYYKTTEGEWYSLNEDEAEDLNLMGMNTEEKNNYFGAKNKIYSIKDDYEDMLNNAMEDEKTSINADKKKAIIDEIRNSGLADEYSAYLYDKSYASTDTLNVVLNTHIPFNAYLDLEYQNFTADKDSSGKSISGSKKAKIMNYIENSGLDYNQKIILHKLYYPADDSYNYEIADYVFNNVDAYEDRINTLETLGFRIGENGTVYWD